MDMQNVAKLEIPEGEVRTIHDKNGDLLWGKVSYSVKYKGNTAQNGAPTPSAPVPVQTVTGDNMVKVPWKNLFDAQLRVGDISSPYANPTIRLCSTQNLYLCPGTYTFSSNIASPMRYALGVNSVSAPPTGSYPTYIYDSGWTVGTGSNTTTFTINQGGYFSVQLSKVNNAELTISEAQAYRYQLELGTSASSFEPYQSQSYEVNLASKNLLDITTLTYGYVLNDGGFANTHAYGEMRSRYIKVDPSTTYTFSIVETSSSYESWFGIGEYSAYGSGFIVRKTQSTPGATSFTFTTSANCQYVVLSARNLETATKVQFEKASAPTSWETFWQIELCKIGDYQDYIYKSDSKWYAHKEIGKIPSYAGETISTDYISTTGSLTTGATVYYALATPTDTEITNQALTAQLEAVSQWMTRYGYNASVTGNLPIIIDRTQL